LLVALAIYCGASLIHFAHNAEFISEYPNLPIWLTRSNVYVAWLAVTLVGASGVFLFRLGVRLLGLVLIAGYAALGFAGLDHYTLASPSAHTLTMNATILFEVTAAAVVFALTFALLFRFARASSAAVDA
jgi:hypothetical protein